MLFDTHCHLVSEAFDADRDEAIARAAAAGVESIICVADTLPAAEAAVALASSRKGIWATAGVHPHEAGKAPADLEARLRELLALPNVIALGEVGLDYHYDFSPRETQKEVFRRQIRLAVETGKPLIIHNRESDADVITLLADEGAERVGGVLHCFWGDRETALAALEMGFFLGVGGPVTFKNAGGLREILRDVPLERLLIETDAPYLAPVPYRGKRNEPAFAVESAKVLAELKGVSYERLADVTTENARRLFQIA